MGSTQYCTDQDEVVHEETSPAQEMLPKRDSAGFPIFKAQFNSSVSLLLLAIEPAFIWLGAPPWHSCTLELWNEVFIIFRVVSGPQLLKAVLKKINASVSLLVTELLSCQIY